MYYLSKCISIKTTHFTTPISRKLNIINIKIEYLLYKVTCLDFFLTYNYLLFIQFFNGIFKRTPSIEGADILNNLIKDKKKSTRFKCNVIGCNHLKATKEGYSRRRDLLIHINNKHTHTLIKEQIKCPNCKKPFSQKPNLGKHLRSSKCGQILKTNNFKCGVIGCGKSFKSKFYLKRHIANSHIKKKKKL